MGRSETTLVYRKKSDSTRSRAARVASRVDRLLAVPRAALLGASPSAPASPDAAFSVRCRSVADARLVRVDVLHRRVVNMTFLVAARALLASSRDSPGRRRNVKLVAETRPASIGGWYPGAFASIWRARRDRGRPGRR